jgi:DHA1 family bicyclomycin/chloramphenicol resistance-like MFS transporter
MPLLPRSRAFTIYLAGLSALPPLATDMALPGLGAIEAEFGATEAQAAATIAIFLAGFAAAPIPVGPLTDRYGRKPVILIGAAIFAISSFACAFAPTILILLIARLVQGLGAGAAGILPRAIVRDLFDGREARLRITAVSIILGVAPAIAPTLGAGFLAFASWRVIFLALGVFALVMALVTSIGFAESHPREKRHSLQPTKVAANYRRALTNPTCLGFALVNAAIFAGLFGYINVSPLLFIKGYGVSNGGFAALFAITASGVMMGSLANNWLVRRGTRPKSALDLALALAAFVALALAAISLTGRPPAIAVAGLIVFYVIAFGLTSPNASHEAMQPLPDLAGFASAIMLCAQMMFGAIGGSVAAALYRGGSPLAIAEVMCVGALSACALYFLWLRPRVTI